jgi:hypothetical protein
LILCPRRPAVLLGYRLSYEPFLEKEFLEK